MTELICRDVSTYMILELFGLQIQMADIFYGLGYLLTFKC